MFDKKYIQTSNPYRSEPSTITLNRIIYYGTVIDINDDTDGGRIKVRVLDLDNNISDDNLSWSYPLLPKFFHIYPQIGEIVRIFIEDVNFPQKSRFWLGSVISQPHKIGYDKAIDALSTTNIGLVTPNKAPSTYPEAQGVFPLKTDVALIGKVNTDVILRINEVHIRAGKHVNNNILKLNKKNPAEISMVFEPKSDSTSDYYSNTIIVSDKIALITHSGNPQFKAAGMNAEDRTNVFSKGHPIARGDVLIEALNVMRTALLNHIHGYSGLSPEKTEDITKLEKLKFEPILQKNIVVN